MKSILHKVIQYGTGKRARDVRGDTGGKTGTSNESRDAWFIGFRGQNITGVWIGHDLNESLGKRENGGNTAVPVWRNYLR